MDFRNWLTDSVSYWERKRIVYNAVLLLLVLVVWGADIVAAGPADWIGAAIVLFAFATIANTLYCLAYVIDFAFQVSPARETWRRLRWMLFTAGLILASTLALWVMVGPGMA